VCNRVIDAGRDFWTSVVHPLLFKAVQLDQVTLAHVHSGFEYLQGYRFHSLSEQPVLRTSFLPSSCCADLDSFLLVLLLCPSVFCGSWL